VKSESRSLSSGQQFQENKMSWTQMNADFQDSIKAKTFSGVYPRSFFVQCPSFRATSLLWSRKRTPKSEGGQGPLEL
jgi:hypothetical protein